MKFGGYIMHNYKIFLLAIVLIAVSCDEVEDNAACVDSTAAVLAAGTAYEDDMSLSNCQALKTAATDFVNNSCDTTGVGDVNFIVESLDCEAMVCAMPLANLISYSLQMEMANDSVSYCTYFDSTMIAAASLLENDCWGEDSTAFYTAYYDSIEAAGCDWFDPVAQMPGQWQTVKFCNHEDGENCAGEMFCEDVEPRLTGGFNFVFNNDGTFSALGVECNCDDEDGNFIGTGCDWDEIDETQPDSQAECEALGGNWWVEYDELGTPIWTDNQFSVTMDESDCDCEDEDGNYIEGCDWDAADDAEDASECASVGGFWEEDMFTIDFSVNATADTIAFNFQDYDEEECDCEDEDGDYIEGCDWNEADNAEDQASCESLGAFWKPDEYICFTVYNAKFPSME